MTQTITLIPGDGIGPEVAEAVVRIFKVAQVDVEWERHDAGVTAFKRYGQSLPPALLDSIRRNRIALKGPVTTPIAEGFTSVNVGLRKALDLYANLRPVRNLTGVESRFTGVESLNATQCKHRRCLNKTTMALEYRRPLIALAASRSKPCPERFWKFTVSPYPSYTRWVVRRSVAGSCRHESHLTRLSSIQSRRDVHRVQFLEEQFCRVRDMDLRDLVLVVAVLALEGVLLKFTNQ